MIRAYKVLFFMLFLAQTACMPALYKPSHSAQAQQQKVEEVKAGVERIKRDRQNEWAKADYDVIRNKLAIEEKDVTFSMLSNQSKPTKSEAQAISKWADFHLKESRKSIDFIRKSGYTEDYITIFEVGFNVQLGILLELYNGQISYGEALSRTKQSTIQRKSDLAHLDQLYSQRNLQAQQQAAALAQQRQQAFAQYLANYNLQQQMIQQQQQQSHGVITCNRTGVFTNCTY